ncbi:hypothetical protein SASPL_136257 [Salvia splendens]|uniref:Shikimate O-hydroxycinnamoyltransferase n=1 Tax=Salvia splendens TaxID=180675 RepID=A0A8X8ZGH0_SALSN|nr:hypothetical protein SASPL_136257 [Salvia splendens]
MEVISSCLVGRENNEIANPITRLELNPWDLRLLPIVPIQRGLIYHKPQSQNIISHLKNSLSRTLNFFPPLAGRLSVTQQDDGTKSYFVDCNNAGAEFTHAAAASVSVSDLIGPKYIPEIVYSFFPLDNLTNFEAISKALLAVQVTELADGLFRGCAANHAVVDGTSFWHFINSWRRQQSPSSADGGNSSIAEEVGARSRIGLGEGYFGNAIYTAGTSTTERELMENGLGYAALKINELVKQQKRNCK